MGPNGGCLLGKHLRANVKQRGGELVIRPCLNQNVLESNVRPSVCQLKFGRNWFVQQDNDPKDTPQPD